MRVLAFRIAIPFLISAVCLEAQWQDRLYPFIELTDDMLAEIDLRDGSVDDWLEVLGNPALTPLDFATPPSFLEYDPSSFDFRIWLAWHDAGNHLFVAAEIVDDIHVDFHAYQDPPADRRSFLPLEAAVFFKVDGDNSGGTTFEFDDRNMEIPELSMIQAQEYFATAKTFENDSNVTLESVSRRASWVHQVPYADGGGSIVESQPIFYVIEFYVTPFDRLIADDPEQSLVTNLANGKTIGFAMAILDTDTRRDDGLFPDRIHSLLGPDGSWEMDADLIWRSDHWAQGILLGADDGTESTAVERATWARIKASLFE